VALGSFDEISGSPAGFVEVARGTERRSCRSGALADSRELGLRAGESDCSHGGLACLRNRNHVRDIFSAPKIGDPVSLAGLQQAPGVAEKPDRRSAIGHFEFDAAQLHGFTPDRCAVFESTAAQGQL